MALNLEELEEQVLALPAESRHHLAVSLWSSLEFEEYVSGEFSDAQIAEFKRRAAEVEDGTAVLMPYEAVKQRISDLLRRS